MPETATETTSSPIDQATACQALLPIGRPSSSSRIVSITGLPGWCSAKPCSHQGVVWMGTKALLG
jgi:hypothetical protein